MPASAPSGRAPSLRAQLSALVAAVALPLLALQVWASVREYRQAVTAAETKALTIADAAAVSTGQFFSVAEGVLSGLAVQLGPSALASASCDTLVRDADDILDFVVNLMLADASGNVLCASRRFPAERPNITEWVWYDRLISTRAPVVSGPIEGSISGTWVVSVAAPVPGPNGTVQGVVIGSVPLLELDRLVTGLVAEGDELITIVADGMIAARSSEAERYVGGPAPRADGPQREISPGRWVAAGSDLDGVSRAWGQVRVPGLDWTVYVGIPAEEAFGPVIAAAARRGVFALGVLVLSALLAGLFYRRITRALGHLVEGTRAALAGTPMALPEGAPVEVREVAEQFNQAVALRLRAEEAERAMRERHTSIFDNAVFGICVATSDGTFLEVNPALVAMLGYPSAAALIEAGPGALYRDPEERKRLLVLHADRSTVEELETEWVRADGRAIAVRLNGRIMTLPDGRRAFETIVEDITDERRREEELRQTQKMEAVGRLAGGIAHDFNNLLTVIDGNLELALERLEHGAAGRAEIAGAVDAVERATGLTRQLLSFSRKDTRAHGVVDLNEVVAPLERMLGRLLGDHVALRTYLGEGRLLVEADPGQLEQVVMNLVINARDALPEGGTITLRTARAAAGDDTVVLSVADDGVGMDADTRSRIFEPFFTTKSEGKGTGLGLSTVYGIVRNCAGTVTVESEQGRGTRFEIRLPGVGAAGDAVEAPEDVGTAGRTGPAGSETILVVDDDPMVRELVRRTLESGGYRVLVAGDGAVALEVAREHGDQIDLVLTDVVMPGINGPALASRLEADHPGLPVLYMSGYTHNLLGDGLGGDYEVVEKPFKPAHLLARVRATMDRGGSSRKSAAS